MALLFPKNTLSFNNSEGELAIYQSLAALDSDYAVFYSYRWLGGTKSRHSEGEADFVILHKKRGILVIEAKAGGISFEGGAWWQENRRDGTKKQIDPLWQAGKSQHRIRDLLSSRYKGLLVGRAAWFPSVILPSSLKLPAEIDRAIILDQNALDFPAEAITKAYDYWEKNLGMSSAPLGDIDFRGLIEELLPSFRLVETLSSASNALAASYIQLTRQQAAVLDFLREQRTAAIHGAAGTGKTLLAAEKAKMLADAGERVLYLCYNEFLLGEMRRRLDNPLITVHNVRTLAEEILADDSLSLSEVIPFFEKCFAEDFNDADWLYPNIVVDEGQDISDNVLMHLASLAERADGAFYVFYDRNQYIMTDMPEWIEKAVDCRLVLYKNCRNTAEIAASVGSVMHLRDRAYRSYLNSIHGLAPKAVFYQDAAGLQKIAADFVKAMLRQKLTPDDIIILAHNSVRKSLLNGISELFGVEVSTVLQKGCVLFTSVRKYKGLEAKAVLITDVKLSGLSEDLNLRILYVGETRANDFLQVALEDDVTRADYGEIIALFTEEKLAANRQGIAKALGLSITAT